MEKNKNARPLVLKKSPKKSSWCFVRISESKIAILDI
jgi:hypothetical protein